MRSDRLLLLEFPDFSARIGRFLQRLEHDSLLQQLFIRDPGGVLSKSVFSDEPTPPTSVINQGNRLMFALLSNDGFMSRANSYGERLSNRAQEQFPDLEPEQAAFALAATLDPDEVYTELIDAALDNVDRELLAALMVVDIEDVSTVLSRRVGVPDGDLRWSPVAIVVVVIVAVAAVIATVILNHHVARAVPEGFAREDLGRLSRLLMDGLAEHARELREAGVLASAESARRGTSL